MQTERQYGFLVTITEPVLQDEYIDLKRNLENVCRFTLRGARYFSQKEFCVPVRLKPSVYFTIYVKQHTLHVGILDFTKKKIFQEYPFEKINPLLKNKFDDIMFVSESTLKDLSLGKQPHLPEISKMWKELLGRIESTKSPLLSKEELHSLAEEFFLNEEVCLNLVNNPNIAQETLFCLSHSPYISVKKAITELPKLHPKVLKKLLEDPQVAGYAELHPGYAKLMKQKQNTLTL